MNTGRGDRYTYCATPTAAGSLEFCCAVPGHKESGMVGMIAVD